MDFLKHIGCARLDSQSSFFHDAKPSAGHLGARRWKLSPSSLSLTHTCTCSLFTTLHFSLCNYYTLPSLFIPPTFYSFTYFYPTHALLTLSLSLSHSLLLRCLSTDTWRRPPGRRRRRRTSNSAAKMKSEERKPAEKLSIRDNFDEREKKSSSLSSVGLKIRFLILSKEPSFETWVGWWWEEVIIDSRALN